MIAHCGICDPDYRSNWTYIELAEGWPRRMLPFVVQKELGVLLSTPGVPFEWVAHVLMWSRFWQDRAREIVAAGDYAEAGRQNALSITEDDARLMLARTRKGYRGQVPDAVRVLLLVNDRKMAALARQFGLSVHALRRWKRSGSEN